MKKILLLSFIALSLLSCRKDYLAREFGIFEVLDDNRTVQVDGDINVNTLSDFNLMLSQFPRINKIKFQNANSASNQAAYLPLYTRIHEQGLDTHILEGGEISASAVNIFLAGTIRSRCSNGEIGLQAWTGEDANGNSVTATDFPVGDAAHQPFLNYYQTIGLDSTAAADFYYFAINAAPSDSLHWMTNEEILLYGLLTD